jgi:pyridoxine 5-phosphate synthase
MKLRLGVNIDHVATIRNARGGPHPDPLRAAHAAAAAGADGITAHLREDRRHITDNDIDRLMAEIDLPLNLEMAATEEMLAIALAHQPHAACIVPEKREERTTEGGLDAAGQFEALKPYVARLADAAALAAKNGIEPHAGHGLTFDNVVPVAAIPQIAELNIGHFLIGEAIFTGLEESVRQMRSLMDQAR